jgi:uncharacterized membrane protein YdjX (TVP38/TMEM64 family)
LKKTEILKKGLPLGIIIVSLAAFFYFGLDKYMTLEALKQHRHAMLAWTQSHTILAMLSYMLTYILLVAISFPGASLLTIVGGFLFGIVVGSLLVSVSATVGASIIFWAARTALGDFFEKRAGRFIGRMEKGFQENALSYLLVLRLIPIFPFWLVNIMPAILNIRFSVYLIGTFLGIIPGVVVYVMLGNGLGFAFDKGEAIDFHLIYAPQILIPIVGLAILSFVPMVYKAIKKGKS